MYHKLQDEYTFQNKYGKFAAKPILGPLKVNEIFHELVPEDALFSLDTAEQIVLITENISTQIGIARQDGKFVGYLLVHLSQSDVVLVRVSHLEYVGGNAQKILAESYNTT